MWIWGQHTGAGKPQSQSFGVPTFSSRFWSSYQKEFNVHKLEKHPVIHDCSFSEKTEAQPVAHKLMIIIHGKWSKDGDK